MAAVPPIVIADRAVGTVLASAAVDTLGAGYRFGPALPDSEAVVMKGGGTFRWAPGEWTDDTYDWLASMREGLAELPNERRDRRASLIDEAASESPRTFTNNGWVVHAFQATLAPIVHGPVPDEMPCRHLELALAAAVRCGNGTVAAIADGWVSDDYCVGHHAVSAVGTFGAASCCRPHGNHGH